MEALKEIIAGIEISSLKDVFAALYALIKYLFKVESGVEEAE